MTTPENGTANGGAPESGTAGAPLGPATAVWLVARREMVTRIRSKAFIFGTVTMVAAIGLVFLVPSFIGLLTPTDQSARVTAEPGMVSLVEHAAEIEAGDVHVTPVDWPGSAEAEQAVDAGELDAALVERDGAPTLLIEGTPDTQLLSTLDMAYAQERIATELAGSGADEGAVQRALQSSVEVRSTSGGGADDFMVRMGTGYTVTFVLYLSILVYGVHVAQGVVEEKAGRVVELLLPSLRPWQLLLGKITGIGALGLAQVIAVAAVGMTGALATGYLAGLPVSSVSLAAVLVVWFVLGYLFFASLLAASGALVSRQEDLQSAIQPVIILIVVPLITSVMAMTGMGGPVFAVLAVLPPFSPFMMPMLLVLGEAAWWQNALALVLLTASLAGVVWLASRIYTGAVMRTGSRVKIKEALGRD